MTASSDLEARRLPAATRWNGAPPFGYPPRRTRKPPKSRESKARQKRTTGNQGLAAMLQESLARGHWRVALRRYAMLNASGQPIPSELRARCKGLAVLMTRRELTQIIADALDWAAFAGMGHATARRSVIKTRK